MFLEPGYTPSAATRERLQVVRQYLIVHPSGLISKLEAGENDPLPDDQADAAHKRTAGTVDLQPEDQPAVHALYDGEVRVFDDLVGEWVAKLEQLGMLNDTLIILTADHGEELMERGHVGHCSCNLQGTLYDEALKVPLLLRYPKQLPQGQVVRQQISHIDLMPTVFDLLGWPLPATMEGRSTLPLIRGETNLFRAEAYAETTPAGWQALEKDDREIWCVRTADWKLILHTTAARAEKRYELFDLQADSGERTNRFDSQRDIVAALLPKLTAYVKQADRNRCSKPAFTKSRNRRACTL
jgi:arylsulfatase A-like enzyme